MSKCDELLDILKSIARNSGIKSEVVVNVVVKTNIELNAKTLNELVNLGYLRVRLVDKVITCPKCGSASVLTKYVCSKCLSLDVVKSRLIQHVVCGFTGSELEYLRSEKGLKCPKCGMIISDENKELRVYASFFECKTCHYKTSVPELLHVCYSCRNIFRPIDATYKEVFNYEVSEEGLKLLGK